MPFLNVEPLLEGLPDVRREVPSALPGLLRSGEADLATMPVGALIGAPDLVGLPSSGVACEGPVRTVLLRHRAPLGSFDAYRPDPASRSSNLLAAWLLSDLGCDPRLDPAAEAAVVIGDPAFAVDPSEATDLGEAWVERTGLPFVFALWVAGPSLSRDPVRMREADAFLAERREAGLAALEAIAHRQSVVSPAEAIAYLSDNIRFRLGETHRRGADLFAARSAGLSEIVTGSPAPAGIVPWLS